MKKILILYLLIFIVSLNLICCGNTSIKNKTAKETNESTQKQDAEENSNDDEKSTESEDYSRYTGTYVLEKLLIADYKYGTRVKLNVKDNGNVDGILSSSTENLTHVAQTNFSGHIKNNELTATFNEDGWEHSGTIKIEFKENHIVLTSTYDEKCKNTNNTWGIGEGTFELINENTKVNRTLNDLIDGGLQVINNQTFDTKLDNFGNVKFISGMKREDANTIFVFYIADRKNNILYKLSDFSGNKCGTADQVNCVAFNDLNGDGIKDILLICSYKDFDGNLINKAGVYFADNDKFKADEKLNEAINNSGLNDKMENVVKYIKEN